MRATSASGPRTDDKPVIRVADVKNATDEARIRVGRGDDAARGCLGWTDIEGPVRVPGLAGKPSDVGMAPTARFWLSVTDARGEPEWFARLKARIQKDDLG